MFIKTTMRSLLCLLLLTAFTALKGQDIRFSQFYNAPIYLNPAFTGTAEYGRAGVNYRLQGTSAQSNFTTLSAFVDYNFPEERISTGMLITDDKDDYSGLHLTSVAIPISYEFQVNKHLALKPALQASYSRQSVDFNNILFADQLDNQGNLIGPTGEQFSGFRQGYFDIAFGTLAYGQNFWFGASIHNLLENNVSFLNSGRELLLMRVSIHGGYKIDLRPKYSRSKMEKNIMPSFSYVSQGQFSRLDFGLYAFLQPVIAGVFYRNAPLYNTNNAAVSIMAGVRQAGLTFSYSYDHYLETFNTNAGGGHEFTLTYLFDLSDPHKPPRSKRLLKCPII